MALFALLLTTIALSKLERAAPTVDRATQWVDKVKRGQMLRQVRGPGTLVPEQIRWISAVTAGRVERIYAEPGAEVNEGMVLLELSNPDVQLELLEAQRQLTEAQGVLVNLRATLETQRLDQEATIASVRSEHLEAKRNVEVAEQLSRKDLIAQTDLSRAKDKAEELATRSGIEGKRLTVQSEAVHAQLAVQQSQVERLRAILEFRRQQLASMKVVAGAKGVLQELPLEVGQWAMPGATLAKVVQPGRLKAVLKIPETQAKDVSIGQSASVDTRNGIIAGHVVRMDPSVQNGTVTVDVALDGALPSGARPDLSVDGTIEIERLENVLHVGRPAYGQSQSTVEVFRLSPDGKSASRVKAKFGRSSVNTIEILEGLREGEEIILSDVSAWDGHDRIRLK